MPTSLATYLNDPRRPADALRYHELQGYLFAVAAAPELIAPAEWLPLIIADGPALHSEDEANTLPSSLMDEYNVINDGVFSGQPALPAGCTFFVEPLANLEPAAPISQWSRGFVRAHRWLGDLWEENVPAEWDDEYAAILMTLSFYSSRELATAFAEETKSTVGRLAGSLRNVFTPAMEEYVDLGRIIGNHLSPGSMPLPSRL